MIFYCNTIILSIYLIVNLVDVISKLWLFRWKILKSQVVLSCIEGSPAARAGIHQGDELVEINGTNEVYSFLIYETI